MFKLPSLFGRIPRHQKFNFEPRFYDAQKEEREARNARIAVETGAEPVEVVDIKTRMSGSFKNARKLSKSAGTGMSTVMMRLLINLLLVLLLIGWLQWGNAALYLLLLIVPVYAWFRFFRK